MSAGAAGLGAGLLAQFSFAPRSSHCTEDSDSSPEPEAIPRPDPLERSPKRARLAVLAVAPPSTSSDTSSVVTPASAALAASVPTAVKQEEVDAGNSHNIHPSPSLLTAGTSTLGTSPLDLPIFISAKMKPAASAATARAASAAAPAADGPLNVACESLDSDTRRKLREYGLIRQWRVNNKQTVDDFHNFLCELRGVDGRCDNPARHPNNSGRSGSVVI